jgi:DNA primase
MDAALVARALELPFRHPALDAVRVAVREAPDMQRPGWSVDAVAAVREPYRSLAAELLASDFPALSDDAAVSSASDLARRLVMRGFDREKAELLGAIQRVPADSEEGRAIRLRLRELDARRQALADEAS